MGVEEGKTCRKRKREKKIHINILSGARAASGARARGARARGARARGAGTGGASTGGAGMGGAGTGGAGPRLLRALLLLPGLCVGFNVDVRDPQLFLGPPEAQFGYKVLQRVVGGEKWLLVAAPWDGDGQGDVYKCRVGPPNATCDKANLGCSTYMDIVIVLDGSNSIYPWVEVQNFLSNVLSRFFIGPGQIQVGVLQYGEHAVHEWALGRYRSSQEVVEAARNISRQEGRETRTAMAVRTACAERGGRADATRLMIVVTDGESHDGEELPGALAECDRRNVTRYAIAVLGHYLRRQQDPEDFIREIKFIASDPDEKYFFNVTDEAALNDIVDALGDRIFSLEGTPGHNASSFELEMSQIGFSVHPLEHKGKVILFQMATTGTVTVAQALTGEQIGSYFGSEVCPLDVDGDGVTDVLLVAAPMYLGAQGRETGRVYLYRVGQDSRFGFAMAALPDLNHDGLGDAAVGAPLEGGHRGALYIFHGAPGTLLPQYKQRVEAAALAPALRYFGRSLDGRRDMDGDGLVDVAVGAQGAAVLLRKVTVTASLENREENAYNTSLRLALSPNLLLASLAARDPGVVKLECAALPGHRRLCSVGHPVFRSMAKVSFTLELEFSCSVLLDRAEVTLEATSDGTEVTPEDNVVRLSVPIRYEPELFLTSDATLRRYEVQPPGTFPHGPGPEFKTMVTVQNLGCYPVQNVTLRMALPALGFGRVPFLSVTRVLADNDCGNAWCQELSCRLGRLERGGGASVQLLRSIHTEFFHRAKFKSVRVVSSAWLGAPGSRVLALEEGAQRREVVLEIIRARRVPVSLWILVGSVLGGLLLLGLIIFCLWKLGFFTRKKLPEEEEEEEQ
ncbi:hypothetical protein Q9233_012644 [Columba guinea]|nr:hypothetical protein Q9233_012644 [Columba guinea]